MTFGQRGCMGDTPGNWTDQRPPLAAAPVTPVVDTIRRFLADFHGQWNDSMTCPPEAYTEDAERLVALLHGPKRPVTTLYCSDGEHYQCRGRWTSVDGGGPCECSCHLSRPVRAHNHYPGGGPHG